ncbi:MAG TPA: phage tail domain-containing protein [Metalysinibacillus sp.]
MINLYTVEGNLITFPDGIKVLNVSIPSPSWEVETVRLDSGKTVVVDKFLEPRTISVRFLLSAYDFTNTYELRNQLYNILADKDFYLVEDRLPHLRWRVVCQDIYEVDRHTARTLTCEVTFVAYQGCASTLPVMTAPKEWDIDAWAWGLGLEWDNAYYKYAHTTTDFAIQNIGKLRIDPRKHDLRIEIKATAASYLELVNTTTGDTLRINRKLSSTDVVVVDGPDVFLNGDNITTQTNMMLIDLLPGQNDFIVRGTTSREIKFIFPFYFY